MHAHGLSVRLVKVWLTDIIMAKGSVLVWNVSYRLILKYLLKSSMCNGKHINTQSNHNYSNETYIIRIKDIV